VVGVIVRGRRGPVHQGRREGHEHTVGASPGGGLGDFWGAW